jgi:hypothetical protein
MKKVLVSIWFVLAAGLAFGQDTTAAHPGNIMVVKDARLDKLMALYHDADTRNPSITGYRIQIYSESNRAAVLKVKDDFYAQFPNNRAFVVYQAPNFKLRIGNYRSRLEAYKDLLDISKLYSNAFIVKDELFLSDL